VTRPGFLYQSKLKFFSANSPIHLISCGFRALQRLNEEALERYGAGGAESMKLRKEAKVEAIGEPKQEKQSRETSDTPEGMERLGTNRDNTRAPFRK